MKSALLSAEVAMGGLNAIDFESRWRIVHQVTAECQHGALAKIEIS